MLVLTLLENEQVIIHRDGKEICRVTLCRRFTNRGGGGAAIGFVADKAIGVDREKIFEEKLAKGCFGSRGK